MAIAATYDGDVRIKGNLTPDSFEAPAGSIGNAAIATGATGLKIAKEKIEHMHAFGTSFGLDTTTTVASDIYRVCVAPRAGTLHTFRAIMTTTGTTGDSDFDLLVNGSSVLSSAVNIANTDSDNTQETGTISSASFTAGQRIDIQVTRNSSHDGTGPFAMVELYWEL